MQNCQIFADLFIFSTIAMKGEQTFTVSIYFITRMPKIAVDVESLSFKRKPFQGESDGVDYNTYTK